MQHQKDSAQARHLSARLSHATGLAFTPGQDNAIAPVADAAHAKTMAARLVGLGIPASAGGNKIAVNLAGLRQAIRDAGGDEAQFFAQLAEDIKNNAQENEQPAETRNGQPRRERNQEEEQGLAALAEGLEENTAAVKFRQSLMQRIGLQERFEPGFDKNKAVAEANKLIRAVNKSHELSVQGAKKRENVAAARIEPKADMPEPAHAAAQEAERIRMELAHAAAMEKNAKAFMRGNAGNLWKQDGLGYGTPIMMAGTEIKLPAPAMNPPAAEIELSGPMMQDAIAKMMEKLNLREPGNEASMAMGQLSPQAFTSRAMEQQLGV